jgi:hypothetical protein
MSEAAILLGFGMVMLLIGLVWGAIRAVRLGRWRAGEGPPPSIG